MHYPPKMCNSARRDSQPSVASTLKRPHTDTMIELGWVLFAVECVFVLFFCFVFWYFWSHSAMRRSVAIRATAVYALGCIAFLLLMFFLPL